MLNNSKYNKNYKQSILMLMKAAVSQEINRMEHNIIRLADQERNEEEQEEEQKEDENDIFKEYETDANEPKTEKKQVTSRTPATTKTKIKSKEVPKVPVRKFVEIPPLSEKIRLQQEEEAKKTLQEGGPQAKQFAALKSLQEKAELEKKQPPVKQKEEVNIDLINAAFAKATEDWGTKSSITEDNVSSMLQELSEDVVIQQKYKKELLNEWILWLKNDYLGFAESREKQENVDKSSTITLQDAEGIQEKVLSALTAFKINIIDAGFGADTGAADKKTYLELVDLYFSYYSAQQLIKMADPKNKKRIKSPETLFKQMGKSPEQIELFKRTFYISLGDRSVSNKIQPQDKTQITNRIIDRQYEKWLDKFISSLQTKTKEEKKRIIYDKLSAFSQFLEGAIKPEHIDSLNNILTVLKEKNKPATGYNINISLIPTPPVLTPTGDTSISQEELEDIADVPDVFALTQEITTPSTVTPSTITPTPVNIPNVKYEPDKPRQEQEPVKIRLIPINNFLTSLVLEALKYNPIDDSDKIQRLLSMKIMMQAKNLYDKEKNKTAAKQLDINEIAFKLVEKLRELLASEDTNEHNIFSLDDKQWELYDKIMQQLSEHFLGYLETTL